jgi:hypothetical protein
VWVWVWAAQCRALRATERRERSLSLPHAQLVLTLGSSNTPIELDWPSAFPERPWTHVGVVGDAHSVRLHVDGVLVDVGVWDNQPRLAYTGGCLVLGENQGAWRFLVFREPVCGPVRVQVLVFASCAHGLVRCVICRRVLVFCALFG